MIRRSERPDDVPTDLPRRNGELVFEAPWESRAFGLAAAYLQARATTLAPLTGPTSCS